VRLTQSVQELRKVYDTLRAAVERREVECLQLEKQKKTFKDSMVCTFEGNTESEQRIEELSKTLAEVREKLHKSQTTRDIFLHMTARLEGTRHSIYIYRTTHVQDRP
jgi:uncharacterized coiled-coil protein SlyX